MANKTIKRMFSFKHHYPTLTFIGLFLIVFAIAFAFLYKVSQPYIEQYEGGMVFIRGLSEGHLFEAKDEIPVLDQALYDQKMLLLAHRVATSTTATSTATSTIRYRWPTQAPYPRGGAVLPFKRIVAFYGNLYSTKMGVLGEYDEATMLAKLDQEVATWSAADPETPVVPALHYIVVTAQGSAGADGMYRARMPYSEVDKVIALAKKRNALVFLDFQVGLSTIQKELPQYERYFAMDEVHVGIDPEFSMKSGVQPGKQVGTYDAADINYVAEYLAAIVREKRIPPKILVIHRYTEKMVTNYKEIRPLPEVQVVMDMDGWGGPEHKKTTYRSYIASQPVQFTGFKLFYKNDLWNGNRMLTPSEVLQLNPKPIYIQYQ